MDSLIKRDLTQKNQKKKRKNQEVSPMKTKRMAKKEKLRTKKELIIRE